MPGYRMTLHQRIVRLNRRHPNWDVQDMAAAVKCTSTYVHTVGQRANLKFPRKPYQFKAEQFTTQRGPHGTTEEAGGHRGRDQGNAAEELHAD